MTIRIKNPELQSLIRVLKRKSTENKAPIWRTVAKHLGKSKHSMAVVNLSRLARFTSEGDTVVVPGKVLGSGLIRHKITVAAYRFSQQAKNKLEKAGSKCVAIPVLAEENPKGTRIRIIA